MKVKFIFSAALIAAAGIFSSCAHKQQEGVVKSYLDLKDALYNNNPEKAKKDAGDVKKALAAIKMDNFSAEEVRSWNTDAARLNDELGKIEVANNLKEQRESFISLSDDMAKVLQNTAYAVPHSDLRVQNCPMYKPEGVKWISDKEDIENPYYGKEGSMRSCGETVAEIK
jgi:hypothetical protein